MPHRIEVAVKNTLVDPPGKAIRKRIIEDLGISNTDSVRIIQVYTIDSALARDQLEILSKELFTDPIIQTYSIDQSIAKDFSWLVEIGFKPGVTDSVGKTSKEAVKDILKEELKGNVHTSKQYLLKGDISKDDVEKITKELLANELIERWEIREFHSFAAGNKIESYVPLVNEGFEIKVEEIELNVSDERLLDISRDRVLALTLDEMRAIKHYFGDDRIVQGRKKFGLSRRPSDVELESIAQTWSEHCKHKIFNALIEYEDERGTVQIIDSLFRTFIEKSTFEIEQKVDFLVSVFKDNAGVVKFNDDWNLVMKVETHNTPSALDPYAGALTGIVGVNRDPLGTGKGCRLIFNTDIFCFAPPDYEKKLPAGLFHPRRVFEEVRKGVEDGGNKSGIPTVNGSVVFDDRYAGKPLVYCGTGGIMPAMILNEPSHEKNADPGDLIVMVGGRIGKDGIHGATFSSEHLHEASPTSAVQIGDPFTQKKMLDFLLEARDRGLYKCITDNGAGGLSSSVGEMAKFSNGCEIYLEKVPLKYQGLMPWEILLSEAQERMTLAVHPLKKDEFIELGNSRDVEATEIGKFTESGKFHVLYNSETVAYLDMDFFHNGLPQMRLKAKWQQPVHDEPDFENSENLSDTLLRLLSRFNVCSKEYVVRQYDHEVQGGSVIKPLVGIRNDGPSDAAVIRPLLDSYEGVVVSHGICPKYSDIDTYHATASALDEAIRNAIAVGGSLQHMAALDNFCWPDPVQSKSTPDGEFKLAQLVRANQALYDYCVAYSVPCISGKDSMKNDYVVGDVKISIPPTILFSIIGKVDDVRKTVTMDVKHSGSLIYVAGETKGELGGSEFYAMNGYVGNNVPKVYASEAVEIFKRLSLAIQTELVRSCHDCSDGGLGVAAAEMAFAGGYGMELDLNKVPTASDVVRNDTLLFSESNSRFIVEVTGEHKSEFENVMGDCAACIGSVGKGPEFFVYGLRKNERDDAKKVIDVNIGDLKEAWQRPLMW